MDNQILCPKCESKDIIKRGLIKNESREFTQRYSCKNCNNRFVLDNPFFRMRNKEQIMEGFEATGDFVRDYDILSPTEWLSLYETDEMPNSLEERII